MSRPKIKPAGKPRVAKPAKRKIGDWTLRAGGRQLTRVEHSGQEFDELYVGDWFGMEQMDTRTWWMCVAGENFSVTIPARGEPTVSHYKHGILKGGQ